MCDIHVHEKGKLTAMPTPPPPHNSPYGSPFHSSGDATPAAMPLSGPMNGPGPMNNGQPQYPAAASAGAPHAGGPVRADGNLEFGRAFMWALRTVLRSWQVFILPSIALGLLQVLIFFGVTAANFNSAATGTAEGVGPFAVLRLLLQLVIMVVVFPLIIHLCVQQLNKERVTWTDLKGIHFGPLLVGALMLQLPSLIVQLAAQTSLVLAMFLNLIHLLFAIGILPRLMFGLFLIAEHRVPPIDALKQAWTLTGRKLGAVYVYVILAALSVVGIGIVTLTLGLIVAMPAMYLGMAFIYRQLTGGAANSDVGAGNSGGGAANSGGVTGGVNNLAPGTYGGTSYPEFGSSGQ